ncbi:SLAC1 family transporter [Archaeoglobus sp.]
MLSFDLPAHDHLCLLTVIWLGKIVKYPKVVVAELGHFVMGNFYPLQPILPSFSPYCTKSLEFRWIFPFLAYGAGLILALTVYLSYHFFANVRSEIHHIHGGWSIPPVSTILVTDALLQYPTNELFFFFLWFTSG